MFDVGFSELLVIGVVALVVIGPEKLPRVARTVGALLGRMQRYVNDVKADINREIELDELKKLQTTVQDAAASIQTSMNETVSGFQSQADELNKIASGDIAGLTESKPAETTATSTAVVTAAGGSADATATLSAPGATGGTPGVTGDTPGVTGMPEAAALTASDTAINPVTSSAAPVVAAVSPAAAAENGSHQSSQGSLLLEPAPTNASGAAAAPRPAATV